MKHKIKKNRLKIFIALSLMITCVFGVMFATNTFAYETDTFSYTINKQLLISDNNMTEKQENNISFLEFQRTGANRNYFKLTLLDNYNTFNNTTLLINYAWGTYNNNVWTKYEDTSNNGVTSITKTSNQSINNIQRNVTYYGTSNYITMAHNSVDNNNLSSFSNNEFYISFYNNATTSTNYYLRLYNIDFVPNNEIYTEDYINTYYDNLQNQLTELQEQYDTLENNYNDLSQDYLDLNTDYNVLEGQYADLQDNYDTLEGNYNNLNNATNNGIWTYIQTLDIGDTLQSESYNQQELTNNNILNNLRLELTNTYTDLPNVTNYTAFLVFGNYGDNIFPLNLLEFNINTNRQITQFEIHVSTSDNGTYTGQNARSIFITNEMLVRMNNTINKLNLQEQLDTLFTDNYVVDYIMIDWTKNNNTDIMTLISTNNQYTLGYQQGLAQGNTNAENQVNQLNNRINELIERIESLEQTIETKNEQIALYSRASYGLNNLMWTIGGTPFESFKQIWNVEFLGVDIANFILGIITTFIGLYIVKKFFL